MKIAIISIVLFLTLIGHIYIVLSREYSIGFNWRKYMARIGVYQEFNYIKRMYFRKPADKSSYEWLKQGGYLKQKHLDKLAKRKALK